MASEAGDYVSTEIKGPRADFGEDNEVPCGTACEDGKAPAGGVLSVTALKTAGMPTLKPMKQLENRLAGGFCRKDLAGAREAMVIPKSDWPGRRARASHIPMLKPLTKLGVKPRSSPDAACAP
jgi:hypothetical protein